MLSALILALRLVGPCYVDSIDEDGIATLSCGNGRELHMVAQPGWIAAESSPYDGGTRLFVYDEPETTETVPQTCDQF